MIMTTLMFFLSGGGGVHPAIAKAFNLALFLGVMYMLVRKPARQFFADRFALVRATLEHAAREKEAATAKIAALDARLELIPVELGDHLIAVDQNRFCVPPPWRLPAQRPHGHLPGYRPIGHSSSHESTLPTQGINSVSTHSGGSPRPIPPAVLQHVSHLGTPKLPPSRRIQRDQLLSQLTRSKRK